MDKLLVNKYGEVTCFDPEGNALKQLPTSLDLRTVFIADQDGQAISKTEVIDYKKGDIVITACSYLMNDTKIIVVTDVVGKADITEWYNAVKEKESKKENEAS